jgi:hypothetical protein
MKKTHVLAILAATLAIQAAADDQAPAYWMKKYPGADRATVARCLAEAEDAYAKNLKGGMDGVASAVLWKGNAWEKCMDAATRPAK